MEIRSNQTVGEIARLVPGSVRVFQRHGIDFCCGGKLAVADASSRAGVPVERLLAEIQAEEVRPGADVRWDEAPFEQLIGHIVERYHRPLDEELPRLEAMARKVARVHGSKDPERLESLLATVLQLRDELEPHMRKEENVLFPWILAGAVKGVENPIGAMLLEHDSAAELLEKVRVLTNQFEVPAEACATWRALWNGLERFDQELREHIHLENNVLFPRAIEALS